jgi:hypothetical protein
MRADISAPTLCHGRQFSSSTGEQAKLLNNAERSSTDKYDRIGMVQVIFLICIINLLTNEFDIKGLSVKHI